MNGEKLMRTVAAAFGESDLKPLLSALHEDVVWKSASKNPELFSFAGEHKGHAGVVQAMSYVAKNYTFHHMKPKDIVESGDTVWGRFDVSLSYDAKGKGLPGKKLQLDMAIRWQLKDGKIIEHHAFFDTAFLLMHQRAADGAQP